MYRTIDLLLPSSPLIRLFQPLSPPSGSYIPFQSPVYPPPALAILPVLPSPLPHVLHLFGSLSLLLHLLIRTQVLVRQTVEAEVQKGKTRLGAGPEREVRKRVEGDVLGGELGMRMIDLLREVGAHPGVAEGVRREVEVEEYIFWRKLVSSLS